MQSFIPRVTLCASAVLFVLAPALAQQQSQHVMANSSDIKWTAGPSSIPKGAQVALLYGDPAKDGVFVLRLKFPANYKIPPHTHSTDEIVTVVSGEVNFGMGATFEPAKTKALAAGGIIAMPPGTQHFVQSAQESVVQVSSRGPWTIAYVNPADDPRKSQ